MSHEVIIRGGQYTGEKNSAEIRWTPPDELTDEQEAELFKKKLRMRIYKRAVDMEPHE